MIENSAYANFLKNQEKLTAALKAAILNTLTDLGEDVKGLPWFSAGAEKHAASKQVKKAA